MYLRGSVFLRQHRHLRRYLCSFSCLSSQSILMMDSFWQARLSGHRRSIDVFTFHKYIAPSSPFLLKFERKRRLRCTTVSASPMALQSTLLQAAGNSRLSVLLLLLQLQLNRRAAGSFRQSGGRTRRMPAQSHPCTTFVLVVLAAIACECTTPLLPRMAPPRATQLYYGICPLNIKQ